MANFFSQLGEFLWDVFNNWAGYSTGGIIVATVALWHVLRNIPMSRKVALGLAALFLFMAFFKAWRDQRQEARLAKEQFEAKYVPKFEPRITDLMMIPAGVESKDSAVGVMGTIVNLGAEATVAEFWIDLRIDGKTMHGEWLDAPHPGAKVFVGKTPSGHDVALLGNTHWRNTVRHQPIKTLADVEGWTMSFFPGVSNKEIAEKNATVIFVCKDVTGKESTAEKPFPPGSLENPTWPRTFGDLQPKAK